MGQVDTALLTAGSGHVLVSDYTGGSAGAEPTHAQLLTFASSGTTPSNWDPLGHTSQDNLLEPSQDGGEVTTSGSWQKPTLKTTQEPVTESITVPSIQLLDNKVLTLYYGGGDYSTPKRFIGPATPTPVEKRVCFVLIDGVAKVAGLYWPKCSITRAEGWSVSTENPTELPLKFTRLDMSGQPPFVWINDQLGTNT